MYTLIVTDLYTDDRTSATTSHQIDKNVVTIGRSHSNDIVIRQTNVSSEHASISKTDSGFILEDLNSTNGTTLSNRTISEPVRIFSDDRIEIGGVILRATGHPALERKNATDAPAAPMPEQVNENNAPGMPSLDDLIPPPQTDDFSFSEDKRSSWGGDFSLSSIAPLPSDISGAPEPTRGSIPYESSEIFKPNTAGVKSGNISPFPEEDEPDVENDPDPGASPDSLLAKIEALESEVVDDEKDGSGIKRETPFKEKKRAFDPFSTSLGGNASRTPGRKSYDERSAPVQNPAYAPFPASPDDNASSPQGQNAYDGQPMPASHREAAPFPDMEETNRRETIPPPANIIHVKATQIGSESSGPIVKHIEKQRFIIGRDEDCDLCLKSNFISRHHAAVNVSQGRLLIEDLGSSNGTYVGEKQLKGAEQAVIDAVVNIGNFRIVFRLPSRGAEASRIPMRTADMPMEKTGILRAAESQSEAGTKAGRERPAKEQRAATGETGGGIHAVAVQLHLAKKALGKALDEVQNSAAAPAKIRGFCEYAAQAVRLLYKTNAPDIAPSDLQNSIDAALKKVSLSLEAAHRSPEIFAAPTRDLSAAHALLYALSTEGLKYLNDNDAPPAVSLLADFAARDSRKEATAVSKEDLLLDKTGIDGAMIARTKLPASLKYLSCARTLSRSVADLFLLSHMDSLKLINVVDETCTNVIEHAYVSPGAQNCLYLSFYMQTDNRLAVVVDDRGLPIDAQKAQKGEKDGLGLKLMRAFSDEVHFINRGRAGKRVLVIFPLPSGNTGAPFPLNDAEQEEKRADDTGRFEIKTLRPEAAEKMAECVFTAHGYDYFDDLFYEPHKLFSLLSSGEMTGAGAITPQGTLLGYASVSFDDAGAATGLLGSPVVASPTNSANVAGKLTEFIVEKCRRDETTGLHMHMTASHPYEQIVYASMGAKTTGIMLGYLPPAEHSSDRAGGLDTRRGRRTVVTAYLKLNPGIRGTAYLPTKYADILTKIYEETSLDRELMTDVGKRATRPAISELSIKRDDTLRVTRISVSKIGDDIIESIRINLEQALKDDPVCIYLELPLFQPAILEVCSGLEPFRFIFSGLTPETTHGDMLRLQTVAYNVDLQSLHIENALSKSILKHIQDERMKTHLF